jgi:mannose-binding lectin
MPVLYAEFKGQQQFLAAPTPIPGLSLTIPEGAGDSALVILNVPASYAIIANWTSGRGGRFNVAVDGVMLPEYAEYDYVMSMSAQNLPVRTPATLVVAVPLKLKNQTVVGLAQNCIIDSSASLSVLI